MLFSLDFFTNLWYIGRVMTKKTLTKGNTMKKFYEYMTITMYLWYFVYGRCDFSLMADTMVFLLYTE